MSAQTPRLESARSDPTVAVPGKLADRFGDWHQEVVWSLNPEVTTYRLTPPAGKTLYLKVATPTWRPTLAQECSRMQWAVAHLSVPEVLECDADASAQWLLTAALPGLPGIDPTLKTKPEHLVDRLARALRVFHAVPIEACPFDFRLDSSLRQARTRVQGGLIDPARDFHREYAHLTAEQALERLERERPDTEDLVVCHGDYCPPNILFEPDRLGGFVDLAEVGVADRWWDLAIATWSVGWNLGEEHETRFLESYGAEMDPKRCAYYRLMYDVVS